MTAIKDELKQAFKYEMERADLNSDQFNFLAEFVLGNAYLLQELENIVLSFSKPRLEAQDTINNLSKKIDGLTSDKAELLQLFHDREAEIKELKERNKRLHDSIKVEREERCSHVNVQVTSHGVNISNLVKIVKDGSKTFCVKCTKCGERF